MRTRYYRYLGSISSFSRAPSLSRKSWRFWDGHRILPKALEGAQELPETLKGTQNTAEEIFESALSTDMENQRYTSAVVGLCDMVEGTSLKFVPNTCWQIFLAMKQVSYRAPDRIDNFLRLYVDASNRLESVYNLPYQFGLEDMLATNMTETNPGSYWDYHEKLCMRADRSRINKIERPPGHTDATDRSNVNFDGDDTERLEEVFNIMTMQANESRARIIDQAMYARYIMLVCNGANLYVNENVFSTFLRKELRDESLRNQADTVGTLLCLRGMAKSYLSRSEISEGELQKKKEEWQELLKRWLWDRSLNVANDRMVKYQVMVSIIAFCYLTFSELVLMN